MPTADQDSPGNASGADTFASLFEASADDDAFAREGEIVAGTVVQIAPKADEGSGVNYRVIIELDNLPEAVRWGMTAFVDIDTEE